MGKDGGVKGGGVFSACAEVIRGETVYEREYEPRKRLASLGLTFLILVGRISLGLANIRLSCFLLCGRTRLFLGVLSHPTVDASVVRLYRVMPVKPFSH